jgi:creatinine amidohydrolase
LEATVRVVDLTWPEYAARVADSCPVILPVGALEQHGLHLPLDTDAEIAFRLAERVAREVGGVVLPPLVYGARSLARSGGGAGTGKTIPSWWKGPSSAGETPERPISGWP